MLKSVRLFAIVVIAAEPLSAQEPVPADSAAVAPQELREVVVTEAPVVREAGKESYIITPGLREGTNSAAQLMDKLQGFVVDPISKAVNVGLDRDVLVVVNDKPVDHKFAMSLNPGRIKRVEVLRYPSGRFAGTPILVNIVLYSNYIGTDGNVAFASETVLNGSSSNSQEVYAGAVSSFGPWSIFGMLDYSHELRHDSRGYELKAGNVAEEAFPLPTPSRANMRHRQSAPCGSVGADYRFSDRHTLSVQSVLLLNEAKAYERTNDINRNNYDTRNSINSVFYQGQLSDRLNLNAELSYNYYDINDRYAFDTPDGENISASHYDGTKHYVNVNGGAGYSIDSHWRLQGSYGYTWRNYDKRSRLAGGSDYYFEEQRHRPQAGLSYSDNRRFSARAVAGLLHVISDNIGSHSSHTSFMPLAQIYYAPAKKVELMVNYGGSSSYPSLEMLSPNPVAVINGLSSRGNPDLKAQVMHNAAVELTLFGSFKFSYTCYYGGNTWTPLYTLMPDGSAMLTRTNADYSNQYIGVSYSGNPLPHVRLDVELNYQWQHIERRGMPRRDGRVWYADVNLRWDIAGSGWKARLGLFVRDTREPLLQGREIDNYDGVTLTLQKNFLKNRLSASLQGKFCPGLLSRRCETRVDIPGFSYTRSTDARIRQPNIGVSVSYSFGQGKSRKADNDATYDSEK